MTWIPVKVPKPVRVPRPPKGLRNRKPIKKINTRRKGRAFGASHVDEDFQNWLRQMPCAICLALRIEQTTRTEVEHFVLRSQGGYDRGDCYPTCGTHREMRHGELGPKAFTRMLKRVGFDERKLCKKLVAMYESERWPCP